MQPDLHYQLLEIEPGASQDDIRQAYKDLVKVWHPDRFGSDPRLQQKAEAKLKQINAAYEFLKSYRSQTAPGSPQPKQKQSPKISLNCEKLKQLLELRRFEDADQETKRLLLELARREQSGWLQPEDVKGLPAPALLTIDQLWTQHSNHRFGFSVQKEIWKQLGCNSSANTSAQTISENKFGQSVRWRTGSLWLSPWDAFDSDLQAPPGSLPRAYIFALSGWWSYCKGWTGCLVWRFDDIFLKL